MQNNSIIILILAFLFLAYVLISFFINEYRNSREFEKRIREKEEKYREYLKNQNS